MIVIEQEPGASDKTVVDIYRRRLLDGYNVRSNRQSGSKITRGELVAARAGHGDVRLMEGAWNDAFLDEAVLFPNGAHDDQIDAVAIAYQTLSRRNDDIPIITDELVIDGESFWYDDQPAANEIDWDYGL